MTAGLGLINPEQLEQAAKLPDKSKLQQNYQRNMSHRLYDKRSHCSARGIVTDDQVRNFVDSQINLYHLIRDRPEFYKLNRKTSEVKFRSHRGLTGLYSAVKGQTSLNAKLFVNHQRIEIGKQKGNEKTTEDNEETEDDDLNQIVKSELKKHAAWTFIGKEKRARIRQVQVPSTRITV